jgi:hypothetical protein
MNQFPIAPAAPPLALPPFLPDSILVSMLAALYAASTALWGNPDPDSLYRNLADSALAPMAPIWLLEGVAAASVYLIFPRAMGFWTALVMPAGLVLAGLLVHWSDPNPVVMADRVVWGAALAGTASGLRLRLGCNRLAALLDRRAPAVYGPPP